MVLSGSQFFSNLRQSRPPCNFFVQSKACLGTHSTPLFLLRCDRCRDVSPAEPMFSFPDRTSAMLAIAFGVLVLTFQCTCLLWSPLHECKNWGRGTVVALSASDNAGVITFLRFPDLQPRILGRLSVMPPCPEAPALYLSQAGASRGQGPCLSSLLHAIFKI